MRPRKPNDNSQVESFNGKFRDEDLNELIFALLRDAKEKIEYWR